MSNSSHTSPTKKLNSGYEMPVVGFGTFLYSSEAGVKNMVKKAILEHGYRHIDTAAVYGNEKAVGEAINEAIAEGIPREDLFITTKLWQSGKSDPQKALAESLERLNLDYVDLYLIHGMAPDVDLQTYEIKGLSNYQIWKELEACVKAGKTRSIGVSNCSVPTLMDLIAGCEIKPAVNQIEVHPYLQQTRLFEWHQHLGVAITGYAVIGGGLKLAKTQVMEHPVIKEIALKHSKTEAQVCISWLLGRGAIVLCKTATESRLTQNMDSCRFKLDAEDYERISALETGARMNNPVEGAHYGHLPYY